MSGPVNLRQARKLRARAADRAAADANAARHGISKADRDHAHARTAQADRLLDGHMRFPKPRPDTDPTGA